MPSGNLEEALCSRAAVPWWARIKIAAQVASALSYLHSSAAVPVLHRDVKPANVFLDGDWNAKLGDLGLAAATASGVLSGVRREGEGDTAVGTWPYLAPEYKAGGTLTIKADVYALGVSLLQIVTGQVERLQDLVPRCRGALSTSNSSSWEDELLDPAAGPWDVSAGGRLLRLGLWATADKAEERPAAAVVAGQLELLWRATDETLMAAAATAGQG